MSEIEYIKLQFQSHLEEYKRLYEEMHKRFDSLDKVIYYEILLFTAVIFAYSQFNNSEKFSSEQIQEILQYSLLIITIPFYALAWSYSIQIIYIFRIGKYIYDNLRPRITELSKSNSELLNYERYVLDGYISSKANIKFDLVIKISTYWTLIFPILFISFYIYVIRENISIYNSINYLEFFLFLINIVLLITTFTLCRASIKILDTFERFKPSELNID